MPTMSTTFQQNQTATTGPLAGSFLWSDRNNWTNGIPTTGENVTQAALGADDLSALSIGTLTLSGELDITGGSLTVGLLYLANGGLIYVDDGNSGATSDVLTIDARTGSGVGLAAVGPGTVIDDLAPNDPGEAFGIGFGGEVILAATPNPSTLFNWQYQGSSGTLVLENPGLTISAALKQLRQGVVLELPGSSVTGFISGAASLDITTSAAEYEFPDVTYADGTLSGYTAAFDPVTGLEAITFLGTSRFQHTQTMTGGPLGGDYLWSNPNNWTDGIPGSGDTASVYMDGVDDLAALSLGTLAVAAQVDVIGAFLTIGVLDATNGSLIYADNVNSGATSATIVIDAEIGSQGGILASGAGAVVDDFAPTDPGEYYAVGYGGRVLIAAAPNTAAVLNWEYVGTTGTIALQAPGATVAAMLENVGRGDVLEIPGSAVVSLTFGASSLEIVSSAGSYDFVNVAFGAGINQASAAFDEATGLEAITFGAACFCRGTMITAAEGGTVHEVPIEDLKIGDRVVTQFAGFASIRWIGRRSYAGRFVAGNPDALPILFQASSLGEGVPRRDLSVSPRHAMYIDDMLIPAAALVNGTTIVQLAAIDRVEYLHIELAAHDVILADGAWSETFVDDDSRGMFHNAAEYGELYPDAAEMPARYCAPRVEDGHALEAVRRRLAARGRGGLSGDADALAAMPGQAGGLSGRLDTVDRGSITGWARNETAPERPVRLRVRDNGVTLGEVVADRHLPDLVAAGVGDGCHGFELIVAGGLSPLIRHVIEVQRADDYMELVNSPWQVEAAFQAPAGPLAIATPPAAHAACRGRLDEVTRERIAGWALDDADPETPVELIVLDNGMPIALVLANRHRADIEQAGIGRGRHAFQLTLPGGLSPLLRHVIQVKRERDGADIPGSPAVIEAASGFDAALRHAVGQAVTALEAAGDHDAALSFMMTQTDRLLQLRADGEARRAERLAGRQSRRRWGKQVDRSDPPPRALVIDARLPLPGRDAGSQAILSHMRALQGLGHDVSFVAAEEMERSEPALAAAGITCCGLPYHASLEDVLRRQAGCFDVVYLHRAGMAARYLALARHYQPRARILYSVADLHHLRLARQAAVEARPELLAMSRRLRVSECGAARSADAVISHSVSEVALLRRMAPQASVHHVPWDMSLRATAVPFALRAGVAFIGSYAHAPNLDAARWLVETLMPLVWRVDPAITCLLVGSDMPAQLRQLGGSRVETIGQVADLGTAVFDRVRLTVAPVRFGAGVKGKVLESLAAGTPCVMSTNAAEGLALPSPLQALVGRDAPALAALICRMHGDEAGHRHAAEAGMSFIRQSFNMNRVIQALGAAVGAGLEGQGRCPWTPPGTVSLDRQM